MSTVRSLVSCVLVAVAAALCVTRSQAQAKPQLLDYRDRLGRFVFAYPSSYGVPEVGTDDGFGDRIAAVRFSLFSTAGIGGEAVLNAGRPVLDVLAAGGLYDEIASGTLPDPIKKILNDVLPPLSAANVCAQIGLEQHVDVSSPPFAAITAQHRKAIAELDRMGNHAPRVTHCSPTGDVAVFDKDAAMVAGGPRRRSYGAIRFLTGRYASFQFVRAGGVTDAAVIDGMRQVVSSFRVR